MAGLGAGQCAPVLAAVKQRALDGGCGPTLVKGAGAERGLGRVWWRRVVGGGSVVIQRSREALDCLDRIR
jgi:hypothetical protein